jgi:peptidoglycan/LPS O-acetylase OafA/YrhL
MALTVTLYLRAIFWAAILGYAFWRAPRALPYSAKLARIAIVCGFVAVICAFYRIIQGPPQWYARESLVMTIVGLTGGAAMLGGLICGAIAFFIDAKRSPSLD